MHEKQDRFPHVPPQNIRRILKVHAPCNLCFSFFKKMRTDAPSCVPKSTEQAEKQCPPFHDTHRMHRCGNTEEGLLPFFENMTCRKHFFYRKKTSPSQRMLIPRAPLPLQLRHAPEHLPPRFRPHSCSSKKKRLPVTCFPPPCVRAFSPQNAAPSSRKTGSFL